MSDDLSAQTSAIFEKLYDERGQPDELDDAFTQEYFKLVKDHVKLDAKEAEIGPLVVEKTKLMLSKPDSGLIELYVGAKKGKFIVSKLHPVKILKGPSVTFSHLHGKGTYTLTNARGLITVVIKAGVSTVIFHFPTKLQPHVIAEEGKGEWVPMKA